MKTFNENAALNLMRSGQSLVRVCTRHGVRWYVGNGLVSNETAQKLIARSDVEQFDPGLFADFDFAQSYLLRSCNHV
jgi:hypothetical protein